MKKIIFVLLLIFLINTKLNAQSKDTLLPKFNISGELVGITRGLGGLNLEYCFLKFLDDVNVSLSSGIYLSAVGFANVSNLNISYGKVYCLETSLNLITQLSDIADNSSFETCHYGTNKYRIGFALGVRHNFQDNSRFIRLQISTQWTDTECMKVFNNEILPSELLKNVPLFSAGLTYGIYF